MSARSFACVVLGMLGGWFAARERRGPAVLAWAACAVVSFVGLP